MSTDYLHAGSATLLTGATGIIASLPSPDASQIEAMAKWPAILVLAALAAWNAWMLVKQSRDAMDKIVSIQSNGAEERKAMASQNAETNKEMQACIREMATANNNLAQSIRDKPCISMMQAANTVHELEKIRDGLKNG